MANFIYNCCNGYSWAIRSILLGITGSGGGGDFLLKEDGFYLLKENGDKIILE